jgi:hypothetical protein
MDIAPCKAYIPDEDAKTYRAVFDCYMAKKASCSSVKVAVAQLIEANNEASAPLLTHSQSNK